MSYTLYSVNHSTSWFSLPTSLILKHVRKYFWQSSHACPGNQKKICMVWATVFSPLPWMKVPSKYRILAATYFCQQVYTCSKHSWKPLHPTSCNTNSKVTWTSTIFLKWQPYSCSVMYQGKKSHGSKSQVYTNQKAPQYHAWWVTAAQVVTNVPGHCHMWATSLWLLKPAPV